MLPGKPTPARTALSTSKQSLADGTRGTETGNWHPGNVELRLWDAGGKAWLRREEAREVGLLLWKLGRWQLWGVWCKSLDVVTLGFVEMGGLSVGSVRVGSVPSVSDLACAPKRPDCEPRSFNF